MKKLFKMTNPEQFTRLIEGIMLISLFMNGVGFLVKNPYTIWQALIIGFIGIAGILSLSKLKKLREQYLLKTLVLAMGTWYLMYSSGGINSPFEQWLFIIVAVYPTVVNRPAGIALPLIISGIYLFFAIASGLPLGTFSIWDRIFIYLLIGWIIFALSYSLRNYIENLRAAYETTVEGWGLALELKDDVTKNHTLRVSAESVALAKAMGIQDKDELDLIRWGALLHDIGKMGIPDNILKKPDKLTEEEYAIMKEHPELGRLMLDKVDFLSRCIDIPYCHHERWDGKGYPQGLRAEEIPLPARIFSVVDVWDALTSKRPYREPWAKTKVLDYIQEHAAKEFDPKVVAEFVKLKS